jgi:hypothetical protein
MKPFFAPSAADNFHSHYCVLQQRIACEKLPAARMRMECERSRCQIPLSCHACRSGILIKNIDARPSGDGGIKFLEAQAAVNPSNAAQWALGN